MRGGSQTAAKPRAKTPASPTRRPTAKAEGERRKPGLKDFLIQSGVGYAYKKYLLDVEPGTFLGRLRELLATQNGVYRDLTKEARQDWVNFIEYNQHDVLGMIHVVGYVKGEGRRETS